MIYLRNTTESQKVYIERQSVQTADTREVNYITSGDVINIVDVKLEPYSTTEQVEGMISSAISGTVTTEQMNEAIESAKTEIEAEIPSLDGYATEEWVQEQGYLTEHQSLSAYSTTLEVENMINSAKTEIEGEIPTKTSELENDSGFLTEHQSLSGYATHTEVESAVNQAIEAETARTESTYLKEHQSLSAYSTTEQVQGMISSATSGMATEEWVQAQGYITEHQDLSDYWTSAETNTAIENAIASESARCESTYLKEHQSLSGLFDSVNYISADKKIYFYDKNNTLVGQIDTTDFIKDGMVDNVYISGQTLYIVFNTDAGKEIIELDLTDIFDASNYYTKTEIDNLIGTESARTDTAIENAIASESARCETTYLKEHQSLSAYSTTEQMNTAINTAVGNESARTDTAIENAIASESARCETTYLKEHQSLSAYSTTEQVEGMISSATSGMATEEWVQEQGYLTEHQSLSAYSTTEEMNSAIDSAIASESARCETTYLKEHQSLSAYSTTEQMNQAINTAVGNESARTDTAIENAVSGKQDTLVSGTNIKTINNQSILGNGNIEIQGGGESYSAGTNIDITDNVISVTGIVIPDVSEFVTSADVETQIEEYDFVNSGNVETQINEKLLDYYTSAQTDTLLGNKQDTLVSGTNIKTINNQSILGSGNIEIQGGSGGSVNVIEVTKAEYDALTSYTEDALYEITDADTVDLNDFATSADVQTLSGSIITLSGDVANKADKASTSANSSYRQPYWNAEGIITGGTALYSWPLTINGASHSTIKTSNIAYPNIYAPTSAGSAGQPLLSNGSGAPIWATFKLWKGTQSEYDAITTKDNNTIYFVKND